MMEADAIARWYVISYWRAKQSNCDAARGIDIQFMRGGGHGERKGNFAALKDQDAEVA
jgi:hypothetical protein